MLYQLSAFLAWNCGAKIHLFSFKTIIWFFFLTNLALFFKTTFRSTPSGFHYRTFHFRRDSRPCLWYVAPLGLMLSVIQSFRNPEFGYVNMDFHRAMSHSCFLCRGITVIYLMPRVPKGRYTTGRGVSPCLASVARAEPWKGDTYNSITHHTATII